jgi:hypothetical protein
MSRLNHPILILLLTSQIGAAPASSPTDRIASWMLVGGTGHDASHRFVHPDLFHRGWITFIDRKVLPQIRWGCKRIILRNPFGTSLDPNGGHYVHFTQYQQALQQTPWLTNGFVEQWKSITSRGIEIVAYIGNPDDDPAIQKLKPNPQALEQALSSNLKPYLDAAMSIGLDACAPYDEKSLSYTVAKQLRARGVRVYVEARPAKDMKHWFDFPVICEQNFWDRSDPGKAPDAVPLYATNEQLTGEILLIIVPDGELDWRWANAGKWEKRRAIDVLRSGKTAACPVDRFLELKTLRRELE